jgi:hypothetical protein
MAKSFISKEKGDGRGFSGDSLQRDLRGAVGLRSKGKPKKLKLPHLKKTAAAKTCRQCVTNPVMPAKAAIRNFRKYLIPVYTETQETAE